MYSRAGRSLTVAARNGDGSCSAPAATASARIALRICAHPRTPLRPDMGEWLHVLHHLLEIVERKRLFPVAAGAIGVRMDFDDEPVCADRRGRSSYRRDQFADTRCVARINDDRQSRELLQQGNRSEE